MLKRQRHRAPPAIRSTMSGNYKIRVAIGRVEQLLAARTLDLSALSRTTVVAIRRSSAAWWLT